LIDFYFACNDQFAYDIAICLNAWCFEIDGSFNVTKGRALLAGYNGVRVLEKREAEALPLLARGASLRILLTRTIDLLNVPPGALVRRRIRSISEAPFHRRTIMRATTVSPHEQNCHSRMALVAIPSTALGAIIATATFAK
jgi:homoserine kinase type II